MGSGNSTKTERFARLGRVFLLNSTAKQLYHPFGMWWACLFLFFCKVKPTTNISRFEKRNDSFLKHENTYQL